MGRGRLGRSGLGRSWLGRSGLGRGELSESQKTQVSSVSFEFFVHTLRFFSLVESPSSWFAVSFTAFISNVCFSFGAVTTNNVIKIVIFWVFDAFVIVVTSAQQITSVIFKISFGHVTNSNFRIQAVPLGLRAAIFGLKTAIFRLNTVIFSLTLGVFFIFIITNTVVEGQLSI